MSALYLFNDWLCWTSLDDCYTIGDPCQPRNVFPPVLLICCLILNMLVFKILPFVIVQNEAWWYGQRQRLCQFLICLFVLRTVCRLLKGGFTLKGLALNSNSSHSLLSSSQQYSSVLPTSSIIICYLLP